MTRQLVIRIAASLLERLSRISRRIGFARFAVSGRRISLLKIKIAAAPEGFRRPKASDIGGCA
jgi:hypothetical protein